MELTLKKAKKAYYVEVGNMPIERVHPTLRPPEWEQESEYCNVRLGLSGRPASEKGAGYFETEELARDVLEYWLPKFNKKRYGNLNFSIDFEYAGKVLQRKVLKISQQARDLLKCNNNCSTPRARNEPITKAQYVVEYRDNEKIMYVSRFKQDGTLNMGSKLFMGKLYRNTEFCNREISKCGLELQGRLRVCFLSKDEIERVESEKKANEGMYATWTS